MTRPLHLPAVLKVSGVSFYQDVVTTLSEGRKLVAVADDDNPHDSNAVAVRTADLGELCGFIPVSLAARLRACGGEAWACEVTEVLRWEITGLRIRALQGIPSPVFGSPSSLDTQEVLPEGELALSGIVPGAPVKALSGRDLGVVVELSGSSAVVESSTGRTRVPVTVIRAA